MAYNDKKFIANKIKEFRKKSNLTQAELGEKIGITDKHICKIENATYAPSTETFLRLIEVLNIGLEEFGIHNQNPQNNETRDKFIKLLHSLKDKELEFLYNNSINLLEQIKKYK